MALGVPLYLQLEAIKKQLLPILLSQLAGCLVGVISVVVIAKLMGTPQEIIYSLAPKSVTTPIAMEVTRTLGGIPSLTAAVVVCVGLLGSIVGVKTLKMTHVESPIAQGLSLGTAAPRRRNIHCNGHQQEIRSLRRTRTDAKRHFHRHAHADHPAIIGTAVRACYSSHSPL